MSKWELTIFKPGGGKEKIKNPDWKQIKSYLDQVDGDQVGCDYFDTLYLTNPDFGDMTVTGEMKSMVADCTQYHFSR